MSVCATGHIINANLRRDPEKSAAFCDDCGAAAVTACAECDAKIPGAPMSGRIPGGWRRRPDFCKECGAPYPWTVPRERVATSAELDALVLHVDRDHWLRNGLFGPLALAAALPRLNDDELRAAVGQATAQGLFTAADAQRLSLSLEGRRRAHAARVAQGIDDAFALEWASLPDMTLADAVLVAGEEVSKHRMALWLEDLYVAFASSDMSALKGAITELRDRSLLAPTDVNRLRKFTSTGFFNDYDRGWASRFTRDGRRRAAVLREREDVAALLVPRGWWQLMDGINDKIVEEELTTFLRAIPRGLRELAPEHRRSGGQPFVVENESDLQDFLRAFLRMRYPESLKPEEWTPSTAGKGGRVDFVLGGLKCFVELKVFRSEADWRTTMLPDITSKIERYGQDPRCGTLYVLIYDPQLAFRAAAMVEVEMSKERTIGDRRFNVQVVVTPKR